MSHSATVVVGSESDPGLWRLRCIIHSDSVMFLERLSQQGRIRPTYLRSGVRRMLAPAPFSKSKEYPDAELAGREVRMAGWATAEIPVCRMRSDGEIGDTG